MIRVLLVDDHQILRDGVRSMLSAVGDVEVVGEASDGAEAVEEAARLRPDVIVMDMAMPVMDGLQATLEIRRRAPECRVVILTQHDSKEYIFPLLKAGAAGYLLKKAAGTDLLSAIRAVYAGGTFLHPSVAGAVVEGYVRSESQDGLERLSEREVQVLGLVAEGLSNQEIADRLVLSVKTVMGHRANVMQKLDLHNRTELVKYAIRHGLTGVEGSPVRAGN